MIRSDAVVEKFKGLMTEMDSWKDLADSQLLRQLSVFLSWAIEDAAFKVERARHESFIDTALNRSSILAHGEGMEFMPRKPIPATGYATITNSGTTSFSLIREQEFTSASRSLYTLTETVTVPAQSSVTAKFEQRSKQSLEFYVDDTEPFHEILLGRDISPQVVSFRVYVSEKDGADFVEWTYDRLLTNAYTDSLVYDEF